MSLLVSSVGFEEKFLLRAFLRRGRSQISGVLLVKPLGDNEKVKKAIDSFNNLLKEVSVQLNILEINYLDYVSSVSSISKWIKSSKYTSFVLSLSSGMRIVNLEILSAFLILDLNAEIEVEAESLEGVISWRIDEMVRKDFEEDDVKILLAIHEGEKSVSEISRRVKIPVTTAWRKVNKLVDNYYIKKEGEQLSLTKKGEIFISIYNNFS
ncbi:CRISPR-associated CARF protein Csa3 [Acidianus brierleyi]|uniref:CRISPR locus-related DNA-binding protein n=1 Tax=Acidianus brierleyi TaxID=41673 RepID=A0A2U9IGS0_9CREN|nr:CRISPR-associated CARF protein Csa3 [Acidianus brierleyi]AWR95233.1 CRISPR locus-related DNA-binding protein [Acidianus brierleyi]